MGEVKFVSTVSSVSSIAMLPKGDITMEYLLHDKQGFVVASTGGPDVFEGTLSVKNPMLWWPVGMSDQPAYLYLLKVKTINCNTLNSYRTSFTNLLWRREKETYVTLFLDQSR